MKQKARDWTKSRLAVAKLKGIGAYLTTGFFPDLFRLFPEFFILCRRRSRDRWSVANRRSLKFLDHDFRG